MAGAPAGVVIDRMTAPYGASLILDAASLAVAATAVVSMADAIAGARPHGVVVAAFGDPGLLGLRARLACPVVGIAEAAMAKAAESGRRFAVVTTTPGLVASIEAVAQAYGHGAALIGVFLTRGPAAAVMRDPARLVAGLAEACDEAVRAGADCLIIGGGPLAEAAAALQGRFDVPILQPVPEAVALAVALALRPIA